MHLDNYIDAILRHRWLVISLTLLFMLAMAAGGRNITVSNEHRVMFGENNPQLAAFDALEDIYSVSNTALIAIAPRDGSVFTREVLGVVEDLTETAWFAPYSTRVNSLTNYFHSEAMEDDLIVGPLVEDASSLSEAGLDRVRTIALGSREVVGRLVSPDGRVAGLAVNFVLGDNPDLAVIELTDYLDGMLDDARAANGEVDFYLTGDVVMNRAFADATRDDLETLLPIVFFLIVITSTLLMKSFLGTGIIVVMIGFVISTTMGLAGWFHTVFSPVNSGVPIIVMAISVAQAVHIITHTLSGIRRGEDRNAAVAQSIKTNAYPVFLASITTAIGFLSLNFSDSPPFHILGNFVAFGVIITFFYAMTLLPALLSVLPLRARAGSFRQPVFFDRLGDFVVSRRKPLLWFVGILTVVLITGVPRNVLTDSWPDYFDERYEFRRDTDFVMDNLTGLLSMEYTLAAEEEGGITDPEYLRQVEAFAEWNRSQPEVGHVQAFTDIMKRLNKNMNGDDPAFFRIPDAQDLASQYLLLYELSLPFGSDLNDRIDVSKSATRMTVVIRGRSSQDLQDLAGRGENWLRENAPALATEATGLSVVFAHISQRNIESMLRGTVTAMALISVILVLVFNSFRFGFISLLPNFVPAAMSFGLWGHLVGEVGIASSVVIVVAFGIVVDDTIHFLSRYLRARNEEGLSAEEAVRVTFRSVGKALWTTTLVLSAGFLAFAGSGFQVSWALGLLVTITIGFAIIADFLLLPPLLMALDRRKS
ncbi:MAG: MMPL family transporter [Gemmatimonadetes bacterium]|nr:MMPL family transporter [Gemmatimonadota bacterium]MYG85192.1 MMPL family transporter [Gemmatimonadota bacterium]MYJ91261.1 MMPL family transporter [Gemmatimonadota bacterium]